MAPSMETLVAVTSTNGFNTKERVRRMLLPAFSPEFVLEHPDEVDQIVNMRLTNTLSEGVYRSQLSAAVGFNIEPRVQAIEAPTLVLSGEVDEIVPVQNARNLAAKIRGADLRIIGGGSHLFFIERSDEFNRLLSEFMESVSRH